MKKMIGFVVLALGLLTLPYMSYAENLWADILITPASPMGFFAGVVGGNGAGCTGINWGIGNTVPFHSVTYDLVFSTCTGDFMTGDNWKERMRITKDGNVGIGTVNPTYPLTIRTQGYLENGSVQLRLEEDNGQGWEFLGGGNLQIRDDGVDQVFISGNGNVGIGTEGMPGYPLQMASGAHVTTGGVWTDASSREYKENIRDLTYDEAKLALSALNPSKFNYKVEKDDEYLGFIAEDVPDLIATKDRKGLSPMDIVAVLTKVVQKQQAEIEALKSVLGTKD